MAKDLKYDDFPRVLSDREMNILKKRLQELETMQECFESAKPTTYEEFLKVETDKINAENERNKKAVDEYTSILEKSEKLTKRIQHALQMEPWIGLPDGYSQMLGEQTRYQELLKNYNRTNIPKLIELDTQKVLFSFEQIHKSEEKLMESVKASLEKLQKFIRLIRWIILRPEYVKFAEERNIFYCISSEASFISLIQECHIYHDKELGKKVANRDQCHCGRNIVHGRHGSFECKGNGHVYDIENIYAYGFEGYIHSQVPRDGNYFIY